MNLIAVTLANKRNWDLDMVDGLIVSQRQSQIAEQFEEPEDAGPHQPATGIPTGLGQDVQENIKRRRAK
jgi:hypothetical protein